MHINTFLCLVVSSALAVSACGGSSKPDPKSSATGSAAASSEPACPVAVAGTSATVEDVDNGAALVFVTTGDVAEVRRRVAAMAKMHNEHHAAMGALPDGKTTGDEHAGHDMTGHDMGSGGHAGHDMGNDAHAGHDMSGHGGMIGVHSQATAMDIEGGAKLVFVSASSDVAKLQTELRMHAQHLATGSCSMGKP